MTAELLRVTGLHAFYGESHILHGVDFKVNRGEVVTLLGRNGAGRTTTLKALLGLVGRRSGSVMINGREAIALAPHRIARLEKFDLSKDPALAINVDGRPTRGDAAAKVEIINFDDLECPYCARMNAELSHETLDHYKGLIKIVYKDFPLQQIHPWAMHAAVNANCLAGLSAPAYWAYVDYLHSHGDDISGAQHDPAKSFLALDNIAGTIATQNKVDAAKLAACLKKQDESVVLSSIKLGDTLGIEGTPQVFVDGERLPSGARPVEELWPAIDRALKAQGVQPPPETPPAAAPASSNPAKPGQ